jgi:hypothetical protein
MLSQIQATEAAVLNGSSDTLAENEAIEQMKQRRYRKSDLFAVLTPITALPVQHMTTDSSPPCPGKRQACNPRDLTWGFGNIRPVHNDVASFWQLESL